MATSLCLQHDSKYISLNASTVSLRGSDILLMYVKSVMADI